jgi:hypothetical protein
MHYGTGYCVDEGRTLSLAELVRLLVLGGKLQVEACVAQCVDKVGAAVTGKDLGAAMEVLESVPSELDGRKDVAALRNKAFYHLLMAMQEPTASATIQQRAWGIVVNVIEERGEGESMVEARAWDVLDDILYSKSVEDEVKGKVGTAVARYLGPVHRLWAVGPWTRCCWSKGLSAKVLVSHHAIALLDGRGLGDDCVACCQALPMEVLELALKSEELQLASENDAYALVGGGVAGLDEDEQQGAFESLVKCLRLHHMSAALLTSVVARSKYRKDWPGLSVLCTKALASKSLAAQPSLPNTSNSSVACEARRAPEAIRYEFEAHFELARCMAVEGRASRRVTTRLGVADGYLVELALKKVGASEEATVGFTWGLRRPDTTAEQHGDRDVVQSTGPIVSWVIQGYAKGNREFNLHCPWASSTQLGFPRVFGGRPWGEVVREGSDYLPLTVKVTLRFISDRRAQAHARRRSAAM